MTRIAFALALCCCLIVSACATTLVGIEPHEEYTPQSGEGLLMMRLMVNVPADNVRLSGTNRIEIETPRDSSNHMILVALPSGAYELNRLTIKLGTIRGFTWFALRAAKRRGESFDDWDEEAYYIDFESDALQAWDFKVSPGAINYIGDLIVERHRASLKVRSTVSNRSSFALKYLEEHHPVLLEQLELRWAGHGVDRFFEWGRRPTTAGGKP